jgi:hypothetical protein
MRMRTLVDALQAYLGQVRSRAVQRETLVYALAAALLLLVGVVLAQTVTTHTEIFAFTNGIRVGAIASLTGGPALTLDTGGVRSVPPATETITAGAAITANACGGLKRVTAAGAVTTGTTNTFTAPAPTNAGCIMTVCNVGANTITLDANLLFKPSAGADIALGADDCTSVVSDGTIWRSSSPLVAN